MTPARPSIAAAWAQAWATLPSAPSVSTPPGAEDDGEGAAERGGVDEVGERPRAGQREPRADDADQRRDAEEQGELQAGREPRVGGGVRVQQRREQAREGRGERAVDMVDDAAIGGAALVVGVVCIELGADDRQVRGARDRHDAQGEQQGRDAGDRGAPGPRDGDDGEAVLRASDDQPADRQQERGAAPERRAGRCEAPGAGAADDEQTDEYRDVADEGERGAGRDAGCYHSGAERGAEAQEGGRTQHGALTERAPQVVERLPEARAVAPRQGRRDLLDDAEEDQREDGDGGDVRRDGGPHAPPPRPSRRGAPDRVVVDGYDGKRSPGSVNRRRRLAPGPRDGPSNGFVALSD